MAILFIEIAIYNFHKELILLHFEKIPGILSTKSASAIDNVQNIIAF